MQVMAQLATSLSAALWSEDVRSTKVLGSVPEDDTLNTKALKSIGVDHFTESVISLRSHSVIIRCIERKRSKMLST